MAQSRLEGGKARTTEIRKTDFYITLTNFFFWKGVRGVL